MQGALQAEPVAAAVGYGDRWVEYQQRTRRCPGVAVAVRSGGELVLSSAHGLADVEAATPMRTDHCFRIASHSKMYTATLVAQLVEQELLRFDDPIEAHLPWLGEDAKALGRTTLRELLAHGAGVFRDGEQGDFWQLVHDFPDHDVVRAMARDSARVFPGNTQFKYSNVGYALLGQVLEAVTGQTYGELVRERIVGSLGLASTGHDVDDDLIAAGRLATGYTSRRFGMSRLPLPHVGTGAYAPATGLWATAEDLAAFADAHSLGVPGLLSEESKRAMQQPQWDVPGEKQRYGLGFQCVEVGDRPVIGHGGAFPGFITATRLDPGHRLVVVVLTNAIDGPAAELAHGVIRLVDLAHGCGLAAGPDVGPEADRFAGRFYSLWGVIDVVRLGNRLVGVDLDKIDPSDHLMVFAPVGDDELEIVSTSGMRSPGERVRYDFAADGSARAMRCGAQTLRPLAEHLRTPYAGVQEA